VSEDLPLRRAAGTVAILNGAYFSIELTVALLIGSVALFADSVDFLEDTFLNLLVFVAVAWSARARARVGMVLAGIILVPALATIVAAVVKILDQTPPEVAPLGVTAFGALLVNLTCALILSRHRRHPGGLARAAWLSARNDVLADVAIIGAAVVTLWLPSAWPDIVVGLGIGLLNADAAREVWHAARADGRALTDPSSPVTRS
jgi:Co/Zn/Cd efflux system component